MEYVDASGAESKGHLTISQEVQKSAFRAKENKLKPEGFQINYFMDVFRGWFVWPIVLGV